jgi:hypothetical protein
MDASLSFLEKPTPVGVVLPCSTKASDLLPPIKGQVCPDLFEVTPSCMSINYAFYHSIWMYLLVSLCFKRTVEVLIYLVFLAQCHKVSEEILL